VRPSSIQSVRRVRGREDRAVGRRGRGHPSAASSTPATRRAWPRWSLSGWEAVPARSVTMTSRSPSRQPW